MFSASELSAEQKEVIHGWVADGAQLAEVQKRLSEEFEISLNYMDTRFLALDLNLQFQSEEEEIKEPELEEELESAEDEITAPQPEAESAGGFQPVRVTLDSIARPGAMVSGKVTFSDGESGMWMIDQMGRPSVDPDTAGYRPSEQDLVEFQQRLQDLLKDHV
jgi:hypothetical protein